MITLDPIRRMDDQMILKYSGKFTCPIPQAFIDDNDLQPKEDMVIYRERVNGYDALIMIPRKSIENNNLPEHTNDNDEKKTAERAAVKVF